MLEDADVRIPGHVEITLADSNVAQPTNAPVPEVKPQAKPEPPKHPSFLAETAANLGFRDSDISSITTPELERLVALASRIKPPVVDDNRHETRQPVQVAPPEPGIDWDLDEDGKPLAEDRYAKPLRETVKKVHTAIPDHDKRIAALEKMLAEQGQRTATQSIDDAFGNLGADYKSLFGDGSITKYQKDDPEVVMRNAALNAVGVPANHPEFAARLRKIADGLRSRLVPVEQTNGHQERPRNRLGQYEKTPEQREWDQAPLATTTQRDSPVAPKSRFEQILEEVRNERAAIGQEASPAGDPEQWLV